MECVYVAQVGRLAVSMALACPRVFGRLRDMEISGKGFDDLQM